MAEERAVIRDYRSFVVFEDSQRRNQKRGTKNQPRQRRSRILQSVAENQKSAKDMFRTQRTTTGKLACDGQLRPRTVTFTCVNTSQQSLSRSQSHQVLPRAHLPPKLTRASPSNMISVQAATSERGFSALTTVKYNKRLTDRGAVRHPLF